jgi:hypothetical protein
MVAIFKRFGEEALMFKPLTTTWGMDDGASGNLAFRGGDANMPTTIGHYGILVYVDGVQSATGGPLPNNTPLLEIEYRGHYECQPTSGISVLTSSVNGTTTTSVSPSGATTLCSLSPVNQPLVMAAADNICAEIPAVRCVDDAGVEEGGFMDEISNLWSNATSVVSSITQAIPAVSGLLSALAI